MNPEITTPPPKPSFFLPAPAIVIALIILAALFAVYYLSQQRVTRITTKPPQPIQNPAKPPVPAEFITGQVASLKNNLLILKEDGQERQIKLASQAAVLKQKWFDANSMGTVPAEVKVGDNVSVQTAKNNLGEVEAISVVILTDKPTAGTIASPSGKKKWK